MGSILFYSDTEPYYQFSNYYPAEITIDGIVYPSTEYFYQAQKFMGSDSTAADLEYAQKIREVNTSNKARYLAQQIPRGGYSTQWYVSKSDPTLLNDLITEFKKKGVTIRADWNTVKDNVMRKAVWAKFTQHKKLTGLLVGTGDAKIVEANPRDSYWGTGQDGQGKNMLGRILMEVRAFLSGEFPKPPTENSNWVVPEFILASAYPGDPDVDKSIATVDTLFSTGVNLTVSLIEKHEDSDFNSYRDIVFEENLPREPCEKRWSERYDRELIIVNVPIPDQKIVSDALLDALTNVLVSAVGKHYRLLVHCLGGKGRSGTVIAVMLGKMYGMSADEAFRVLKESFKARVIKGRFAKSMPQTKLQFDQVRRLLDDSPKKVIVPPTVVCIKAQILKKEGYNNLLEWLNKDTRHMYIGRNMEFYVPGAVASKWKNPFSLKKYSLEETLDLYEEHVRKTPELMSSLGELSGKVLGCWCKPDSCHGDVLVKLYNEKFSTEPKIKLAIAGSRDFNDYHLFTETVDKALQEWGLQLSDIAQIISGGARGADTLARKFAKENNIKLVEYQPDWEKHGKAAGPIRNKDIIAAATHLVAFPSTKGKGTQHSIGLAEKAGIPLKVQYIDKKLGKVYIQSKIPPRKSAGEYPAGKECSYDLKLDVTSGQTKGSLDRLAFSPMTGYPGRFRGYYSFENYWQAGKRYVELGHLDVEKKKQDLKELQKIEKSFRRHPKAKGLIPVDAVYPDIDSKIYAYIPSRKEIYVPLYYKMITETPYAKERMDYWKKQLESGKDILIVDYDGPKISDSDPNIKYRRPCLLVTEKLLGEKINDPKFQFGHGYVVAATLLGITPDMYI